MVAPVFVMVCMTELDLEKELDSMVKLMMLLFGPIV